MTTANITLRPIDATNWEEAIALNVTAEQHNFVAPNWYSLLETHYTPRLQARGVYDGDTMVGFVMYGYDSDDNNYWIYRLMTAAAQQGKGYGKGAMQLVMEELRGLSDCRQIVVSYEPENVGAEGLYLSLGFEKTGEIIMGETVVRLHL